MNLARLLVTGVSVFLTACANPVHVDGQPIARFGSHSKEINPSSCNSLKNAVLLPSSLYFMGECLERGVLTEPSVQQAMSFYREAARWGVPEAKTALQRLHQPVPVADMKSQQEKLNLQIQQQYRYRYHSRIYVGGCRGC